MLGQRRNNSSFHNKKRFNWVWRQLCKSNFFPVKFQNLLRSLSTPLAASHIFSPIFLSARECDMRSASPWTRSPGLENSPRPKKALGWQNMIYPQIRQSPRKAKEASGLLERFTVTAFSLALKNMMSDVSYYYPRSVASRPIYSISDKTITHTQKSPILDYHMHWAACALSSTNLYFIGSERGKRALDQAIDRLSFDAIIVIALLFALLLCRPNYYGFLQEYCSNTKVLPIRTHECG